MVSLLLKCRKREWSAADWRKPWEMRKEESRVNHWRLACFKPYNERWSRQTRLWSCTWRPWGRVMYTSSSRSPWRNALLTSSCRRCQLWRAARARSNLTVVSLATGENVSRKSNPSSCVYPLATRRALYRSTVPSALYLILYTHRHPIAVLCGGSGVRVHVWFCWRACISPA